MISINSHFDGGNIQVLEAFQADRIRLKIRRDAGDRHAQWFFFQLCNACDIETRLHIEGANEASYPDGFKDYQAVASYDQTFWFRVPTSFDGSTLTIEHTPERDSIYYAYFAPYSWAQHQHLISDTLESPRARAEVLCNTPDGRPLTLLTLGEAELGKKSIWITARQHPGETMAEWWVEGFLARLLDPEDPVGRDLLEKAVVYVVPNMNPDGSVRGHLRVNAKGKNLNREWKEPSETESPEVFHVRAAMQRTGVDFALDVHGDENLPYNFIAGAEGVQRWTPAMADDLEAFKKLLADISPDFQTVVGYPLDEPGSADLRKCTDYIAESFGCLAMTLEMPFKDTADSPLPEIGWSPGRSANLGRACLDAIYRFLPKL